MYEIEDRIYCYAGTSVLRNRARLRDQVDLNRFEAVMTAQRFDQALPSGKLGSSHYRAIHRHIFRDVYAWAGRYRSVRISRDGNPFCYPEHISREMSRLFGGLRQDRYLRERHVASFADGASRFLATLNAIHPFRDGNGRSQNAFLVLLAQQAGHPLAMSRFSPNAFREAMIASFAGDDAPLRSQIRDLTR